MEQIKILHTERPAGFPVYDLADIGGTIYRVGHHGRRAPVRFHVLPGALDLDLNRKNLEILCHGHDAQGFYEAPSERFEKEMEEREGADAARILCRYFAPVLALRDAEELDFYNFVYAK